jgi:hypothetical protein
MPQSYFGVPHAYAACLVPLDVPLDVSTKLGLGGCGLPKKGQESHW